MAVKLAFAVYEDDRMALDAELNNDQEAPSQALIAVYRDAVRLAGLPEDLWRCAWVDCGPIA